MKLPFPALGILAALVASCGPSPLLDDIQKEVAHLAEPIAMPSIVPPGGVYRYGTPSVTLTTTTPGSRLFFTLNGSRPVYNSLGRPYWPDTQSTDQPSIGWPSLGGGTGVFPLRAIAWRDGVSSKEASTQFRVVGDGGVLWAHTGLGAPEGQVLALNRSTNGYNYAGGWVRKGPSPRTGFVSQLADDGSTVWFAPISAALSTSMATVTGVASDSTGNVYITGNLSMVAADSFQFGGSTTITASVPCGFLAKYNPGGACLWAVGLKATVPVFCTGVAVASGLVYVCGWAEGSSNASVPVQLEDQGTPLPSPTLPSKAGSSGLFSNAFAVQYDTGGNPQRTVSSTAFAGADRFTAIAATSTMVAVVGAFRPQTNGSAIIYPGADVNPTGVANQWNALVVIMDYTLSPLRARSIDNAASAGSQFNSVAASLSSVYAGGFQTGTEVRTWGGKMWAGDGPVENAVVVAYDNSGSTLWVGGPRGGGGSSSVNGLALDPAGTSLFVTGRLRPGNQNWESYPFVFSRILDPLDPGSGRAPFASKVNIGVGTAEWFKTTFPGSSDAETYAVAPGPTVTDGATVFFGGTQVGPSGVNWGQGMQVGAPGPGDNPLVYLTFD